MSPKDFFLHLGVMLTLYVSSISLITLLFQVINVAFPDVLDNVYVYGAYSDPYSAVIRWSIASLVIVFPIYILLSWLVNRDYKAVPEKLSLGIRKTLIFITLFLAGIAIVTDLIVLLNTFLGGEISTRFIFKVLAILVVTGGVFGYYLWDLRQQSVQMTNKPKLFAIIAAIVVLGSLVWGFMVMGSPTKQRNLQFDQQKVSDLQTIQYSIINFWQAKGTLPKDLPELNNSLDYYNTGNVRDPQSGGEYEYRATGNTSFQLCASFNEPSQNNATSAIAPAPGYLSTNWTHGSGRVCFDRTIDPKLYPVNKQLQ